jgi:DNA-binding LytR/AlgR family response regulator
VGPERQQGMKILVLEDSIYRSNCFIEKYGNHDLTIIENAYTAIDFLHETVFDCIFLDNDLGDGNGEGLDVAKFLYDNSNNPNSNSTIFIHSWNSIAVNRMMSYLPNAHIVLFGSSDFYSLDLNE